MAGDHHRDARLQNQHSRQRPRGCDQSVRSRHRWRRACHDGQSPGDHRGTPRRTLAAGRTPALTHSSPSTHHPPPATSHHPPLTNPPSSIHCHPQPLTTNCDHSPPPHANTPTTRHHPSPLVLLATTRHYSPLFATIRH